MLILFYSFPNYNRTIICTSKNIAIIIRYLNIIDPHIDSINKFNFFKKSPFCNAKGKFFFYIDKAIIINGLYRH